MTRGRDEQLHCSHSMNIPLSQGSYIPILAPLQHPHVHPSIHPILTLTSNIFHAWKAASREPVIHNLEAGEDGNAR